MLLAEVPLLPSSSVALTDAMLGTATCLAWVLALCSSGSPSLFHQLTSTRDLVIHREPLLNQSTSTGDLVAPKGPRTDQSTSTKETAIPKNLADRSTSTDGLLGDVALAPIKAPLFCASTSKDLQQGPAPGLEDAANVSEVMPRAACEEKPLDFLTQHVCLHPGCCPQMKLKACACLPCLCSVSPRWQLPPMLAFNRTDRFQVSETMPESKKVGGWWGGVWLCSALMSPILESALTGPLG